MKPDVLIIGAGVIGCATARRLALGGARVLVLEAERIGAGASWAAAGLLTPHPEAAGDDPRSAFFDLCRAGRDRFPALAEALAGESGIDIEYRDEGTLEVAASDAEAERLRRTMELRRAAGYEVRWIPGDEVRRREPALSPDIQAALHLPGDRQVDNRRLVRALAGAAQGAGARLQCGRSASGLVVESGRVRGVRCGPDRVEAGAVVLAAGCGSAALPGPGRELPVEPVRGQMICLGTDTTSLRHVVLSERGYLVPRRDGRILAGSTLERVGADPRPTASGVAGIAATAATLAPDLASATFLTAWAGLRPWTPDGWPLLGEDPEASGLIHATGHGGTGILLAPITAEWVGAVLAGGDPPADPAPFRPDRFASGSPLHG